MKGYNFTDHVRNVLALARQHTARLRHQYVGTEHLLLAILDDSGGIGLAVLGNLDVDVTKLRQSVEASVTPGKGPSTGSDFPYTSRAKKVLELAMTEAYELEHSYVGTEHLLLGVIREEKGIAAQALLDAGVTLEDVRDEVIRLLPSGERLPAHPIVEAEVTDQQFKTAIALVELHRLRFGEYPASLQDLQFLGYHDRAMLHRVKYERLAEGYALEVDATPPEYPPEFWRGVGIRRPNGGSE
ncbi:MAG TPA: Clp protease N-terminal domain-containing protein [Gemmatimonadaceae bacterium]|nr:Clp protease N-terminal domain-containing protein [Gemmatimonadaceae bacterium]